VIYTFGDRKIETQGDDFYVAPGAQLIGSVRLGREASVWFNCVLRGDNEWIEIGDGTNVQDATVIHADPGEPTILAANVAVGHRALLHGCVVEEDSLIGNCAVVLDRARIGKRCLIAAGALIAPGKVIPDGSVVMGVPGKVVREITDDDLAMIRHTCEHYCANARRYRDMLAPDSRFTASPLQQR
jgi:carbonic anhydrase/acetyltransferase-like protein (isoleucine patch superfamily)